MEKKFWFFTNSADLLIYTYGSGDTPTRTIKHKDKKSFQKQINRLKKDGYEFIKDQAKN